MEDWGAKRETMNSYDVKADSFEDLYGGEQSEKYWAALDAVGVGGGDVVLDDGCGTGLFIRRIARHSSCVVGVDLSKMMLNVAKRTCRELKNVLLIQCDADFLPLKENLFDKVFSFTLIHDLPNPERTVLEMARVSKPRSKIVVTALKKMYTLTKLTDRLGSSGMRVVDAPDAEGLKDHVVVCEKVERCHPSIRLTDR